MKRIAKQSSRGSGRGSRLRLTLLLAVAAAFLLVPAAQAFANGTMTVKITGTGSGEVVSGNSLGLYKGTPPIACSYASPGPATGVCENELSAEGEGVEGTFLKAEAAPGTAFAGWTVIKGGVINSFCEEEDPEGGPYEKCAPLAFEGEESEFEVSAAFNKAFTVEKVGGEGTVTGKESGMVCGPSKAYCGVEYTGPETLTASPAAGYAFSKWKGCTTAVGLKCEIAAVSSTTKVIAYFAPTKTFTVEKAGAGAGKVTATGISCDENCSTAKSAIQAGKVVKVTTTPAKGSEAAVLEGGTGSASGCSGSTCEFTIEANSSVKVKFVPKPTSTLTLNLTGPGAYKGKVTGKSLLVKGLLKSGFSCGTGCTTATESFFASDEIELTATAPTGYSFGGWTVEGGSAGTCTGKTTPCKVLSDANKTISAKFE